MKLSLLIDYENPYAWTNLTNMLWVEQPVGTGFTQGKPTATTQEETAQDFIKFFKNWQQTFGISNYKIYVTGESYAGRYVPYISSAMLNANDPEYYNVSGAMIYDPSIGSDVQEDGTVVPFVQANVNLFNFNTTFMDFLATQDVACGYAAYREKYLTFPPPGVQPAFPRQRGNCSLFGMVEDLALQINPCWDIYEVNQQCPLLWDVLAFPTELFYQPAGASVYFNRTDVKTAMHAPQDITWNICNDGVLRPDTSLMSIEQVIPQVTEATNRFLIANGDFDMILITNGTLMSIQNMTWNGATGFQSQPNTPIDIQIPDLAWNGVFNDNDAEGIDGPQGIMGIQQYERGLMWSEAFQSGHMGPEFQPRVSYRHIQWLLGYTDTL